MRRNIEIGLPLGDGHVPNTGRFLGNLLGSLGDWGLVRLGLGRPLLRCAGVGLGWNQTRNDVS